MASLGQDIGDEVPYLSMPDEGKPPMLQRSVGMLHSMVHHMYDCWGRCWLPAISEVQHVYEILISCESTPKVSLLGGQIAKKSTVFTKIPYGCL